MSNISKNNKFNPQVKISKTMSWILRHGLNELKLEPDELGRIQLSILMEQEQMKQLGATRELILEIIKSNDKQRFRLDMVNGIEMIGANQGHSKEIGDKINSEKLMKKIEEPLNLCVHGTYIDVIEEIKKTGLKIMSRTHIHFASGYPNAGKVISGPKKCIKLYQV
jgi:2'-phosphotransferase